MPAMAGVPERYRASIRHELDDRVAGARPELLTWVHQYGDDGATLIEQPEDIWAHERADVIERTDGSAYVVLPLWTTEEAPSDLSAEVEIAVDGTAEISDVHVL